MWNIEMAGDGFTRFVRRLDEEKQVVVIACVETILRHEGVDVCRSDWGKPLGQGLYELRVTKVPRDFAAGSATKTGLETARGQRILLRIFFTTGRNRTIVLLHGYDKGRDASARRQQREIERARHMLSEWKRTNR